MNKEKNNMFEKLIDDEFIELVKIDLKDIIKHNKQKQAFELANLLSGAIRENRVELRKYKEILSLYNRVIVKCHFVALPMLDERDIVNLLTGYFTWQFRIGGYDLNEKLNMKLTYIGSLEDRNKFKTELKKSILNNKNVITGSSSIKTIADWLKDYNSELGVGMVDSLKKRQYLIDLKKDVGLDDFDREKLKVLFNYYEGLKVSSFDPKGFEEEVIITIKGRTYLFRRGEMEPLSTHIERRKKDEDIDEISDSRAKIEEMKVLESEYKEGGLERLVLEEEIVRENNLARLKKVVNKLKKGSLERKAVEEEIKRLER